VVNEVNSPRSGPVNSPRSDEVNSPRYHEVNSPGSDEINSPRPDEVPNAENTEGLNKKAKDPRDFREAQKDIKNEDVGLAPAIFPEDREEENGGIIE
jgi:hypothetical protein